MGDPYGLDRRRHVPRRDTQHGTAVINVLFFMLGLIIGAAGMLIYIAFGGHE